MERIEQLRLIDIFVVNERRPVDDEVVSRLAESIKQLGLRTPITVRSVDKVVDPAVGEIDGGYALVAGRHRLEAMRKLGRDTIPAIVEKWDAIEGELWEISENLHRADLTKEQRDRYIVRYAQLLEEQEKSRIVGQVVPLFKRRGMPKGIAKKVAEKTGLSKKTVQRALNPPKKKTAAPQLTDEDVAEKQFAALMSAWNKASASVRQRFREEIDTPVMDSGDIPTFLRRA